MFHARFRFHTLKRLALALLVLLAISFPSSAAQADWNVHWSYHDNDNGTVHIVASQDDVWIYIKFSVDGFTWVEYIPDEDEGNPNPEDGTTTPGDYDSRMDLARQHGGEELQPSFEDTPLGRYLQSRGIGVGPLHNPADGDDKGGVGKGRLDIEDPNEAIEEILAGGRVGSSDFQPNGGSIGEQLADMVRGGRKGNDSDDDSAKPSDGGLWDDEMPGPPELVNPAPEQGFVLLPATVGEFGDGGPWPWWHTDASAALDPQPVPWAVFGGAVGPVGRPGGVSSANVR